MWSLFEIEKREDGREVRGRLNLGSSAQLCSRKVWCGVARQAVDRDPCER
jgi:hypothetical protein